MPFTEGMYEPFSLENSLMNSKADVLNGAYITSQIWNVKIQKSFISSYTVFHFTSLVSFRVICSYFLMLFIILQHLLSIYRNI